MDWLYSGVAGKCAMPINSMGIAALNPSYVLRLFMSAAGLGTP